MWRRHLIAAVVGLTVTPGGVVRAADGPLPAKAPSGMAGGDADQASLVRGLVSTDEAERARATGELEKLGPQARPALLAAVNGDDPAARTAAIPLLLRLPFDRPQDPPEVRTLLAGYGQKETAARKQVMVKAQALPQPAGPALMLRMLREDPSDDVRWAIVGQLRRLMDRAAVPADATPTDVGRPPNLAAAGFARERTNPTLATALFERAIALEAGQPTAQREVVLLYVDLANRYVAQRRYDEAAELHRRGYARGPSVRLIRGSEDTDHLQMLFYLHARYGPLKGYDADVIAHAARLGQPPLQYCVACVYERTGRRLLARATCASAFACTPHTWKAHSGAGQLLLRLGMSSAAEQQFEASLDKLARPTDAQGVDSRLQLALIVAERKQEFAAAERLRAILEGPLPPGTSFTWNDKGKSQTGDGARAKLEARMHWLYLRAARSKGDANSVKAHAKELARLAPDDADIALDAVPMLKELGRADDAAKVFAAAYEAAKADLDLRPGESRRMNTLAWLCAKCGERLDEATRLSAAALALHPDNPGYLDTAAEAAFRSGKVDEAIALEARAVELRPGDAFLREQLARFEAKRGSNE